MRVKILEPGRSSRPPAVHALPASTILIASLLASCVWSVTLAQDVQPPELSGAQPAPPSGLLSRWLNPAKAPFIPIPEIAVDPLSGTTLGVLGVYLTTDDKNNISRIIAPDVLHNPYFGYGMHARLYEYSSSDEQWSIDTGIMERVERQADLEYQVGRQREHRWSMGGSLIFDRNGTPRFYGFGNSTPRADETNFTNSQELAQLQVGLNITTAWQLLYTGRLQVVDVLPGTLHNVASIESRFSHVSGLGTDKMLRNRLSLVYDTRDELTIPRQGMELIAYGGVAGRSGLFTDSLYTEAGIDGRAYWPIALRTILAAHLALRYLPTLHNGAPFWAYSSIGGGDSETGGAQTLRGYGAGRFYDRNSFGGTVELRQTIFSFNAVASRVDLEVAPFVDVGRVFSRTSTFPLSSLHSVYGVGFRGVARPFVVGHVDIGYGREGVAVFTGINYPF